MNPEKLLIFLNERFEENRGKGTYENQVICHEMMLIIECIQSGMFDDVE